MCLAAETAADEGQDCSSG